MIHRYTSIVVLVVCLLAACSPAVNTGFAATDIAAPTLVASLANSLHTVEASPQATKTVFATPEPDAWQAAPIIPATLNQRAREIYSRGLELGRDPHVFSKVGDCGGTPSWFLGPFDLGEYTLGEYSSLQGVIDYFSGSHSRTSAAVHDGFNAASLLSSIRADPELCESAENPLACEYRLNNPSIALIMLGTNDKFRVAEFEASMRQIIEYTIDQGILPVIASKPDNLEGDHSLNRILYALAVEYELPFWNMWSAAQDLPNGGLQEDGAHLTWAPNDFTNIYNLRTGWVQRNLTALQVLDFLWRELQPNE